MRKLFTLITVTLITGSVFAGGLVTNNNHSAMFTRLQNRNASTNIDAVFFNPAGLTKLGDGLFISVNNQIVRQTKTIQSDYLYLSGSKPREYVGKVKANMYPGIYAAFNTGKLSFSAGFNPIGGGGGATYEEGLPSFESQVAELVPLLVSNDIPTSQYSADIRFEGSSIYLGFQGNVAYKVSDMLSVAAGLRVVSAKNITKDSYITNMRINPNYPAFGLAYTGDMVFARDFFTSGSATLATLSAGATAWSNGLQPYVETYGSTLLTDLAGTVFTTDQITQIQTILGAAGLSPEQIGQATIGSAQAVLGLAAPQFAEQSGEMAAYAAMTQDRHVDIEQTGLGFTPILSLNFSPLENLNIALKYEFKTKLDLTTKVIDGKDGGGLYIQDSVSIADLPAILSAGVEFRPVDRLLLAGSFNCYFDKKVDYDGQSDVNINKIDKNFLEYGLGAEYGINDRFRVSAGWSATRTGVNSNYQSDLTYSTNTNSFGAGIGYRITDMIDFNIGGQYTFYKDGSKSFIRLSPITETYSKSTWVLGAGLDFYFGK